MKLTKADYETMAYELVRTHIKNCKQIRKDGRKPAPLKDTWEQLALSLTGIFASIRIDGLSKYQCNKIVKALRKEVSIIKISQQA